ncbi:carbohydrate-binding module family 20 domain-containing protein [Streptomyces sp. S1D4-11]
MPLSSASYPYWGRLVIAPKSTSFAYKYVKKDSSGNVTWESGANRAYSTGSGTGYSISDTWH